MKDLVKKSTFAYALSAALAFFSCVPSTGIASSAKEFLCTPAANAGLYDNGTSWELGQFSDVPAFLLKIDEVNSSLEEGGPEQSLRCHNWEIYPNFVSCSSLAGTFIHIDTNTGRAGRSELLGALLNNTEGRERDSLYVAQLICQERTSSTGRE